MKKIIAVGFFVLVGAFSFALQGGVAYAEWSTQNSSTTNEFTGISCPDPRTCYLVSGLYLSGGTGSIFKTTDGGDTFSQLRSPSLNPLHAISCPSQSVCYTVGDFGTFLKTTNAGETWSGIPLGSKSNSPRLTNVLALDEQTVIVIGRDATLYRTEDGGASWGRPGVRSVADFYALYFPDSKNGFIGGDDGALFVTDDGGATWAYRSTLRLAGKILGIHGDGGQTLFAVGDAVHKSTDGGKTWTRQTTPSKSSVGVAVVDASTTYILADLNTVQKTSDGGATWKTDASFLNAFLQGIVCHGAGYCLTAGSFGKVFRLGTPPAKALPPPPPPEPTPPVVVPVVPTPAPVIVAPPVVPKTTAPSIVKAVKTVVPGALTRTLKKGSSGNDVKKLQELLAGVAEVYPDGEITGYFGPATAKAVGRFQEKYNLANPGDAGYGDAGPKTRAKLLETEQGEPTPKAEVVPEKTVPMTSAVFTRTFKKGASGNDVKKLQEILSTDKEIYPGGEVTGYFGPATAKALGRFQEKYDIAVPGDSGYGEVGPKTRAKLVELSSQ
ncbi:MAG: YCF48-related protein [bacterium]|nr:YCF48-related protein [bacterium]